PTDAGLQLLDGCVAAGPRLVAVHGAPEVLRRSLRLAPGPAAVVPSAATAPPPERRTTAPRGRGGCDVAIIGLAGRYPDAPDLATFWRNLREGRDAITEIPHERWDHARIYDPDRQREGAVYGKWGGFIGDVD